MNSYGSTRSLSRPADDTPISQMDMEQLKPMLCGKSHGDAYTCIDCQAVCPFGKRAIELLEKETKSPKVMNGKQRYTMNQKLDAMQSYLDAMAAKDPVTFVFEKYNCKTVRIAKNKIYQWQHNYGTNLVAVSNKIKDIQDELAALPPQIKEEKTVIVSTKTASKTQTLVLEDKKPTKRQEEKMSRSYLEKMRTSLEEEYLSLEEQIKEHNNAIKECEKRIEGITEEVQAIRRVLDIFKKKDEMYV